MSRSSLAKEVLSRYSSGSFDDCVLDWSYTGEYNFILDHSGVCELCGKRGLVHHYKIRHECGSELWVGSECILQFTIPIYKSGVKVMHKDVKKVLRDDKRFFSTPIFLQLMETVKSEPSFDGRKDLLEALVRFREGSTFTPLGLVSVLKYMISRGQSIEGVKAPVSLNRSQYKLELLSFDSDGLTLIWPSLSPSQRRWFDKKVSTQLSEPSFSPIPVEDVSPPVEDVSPPVEDVPLPIKSVPEQLSLSSSFSTEDNYIAEIARLTEDLLSKNKQLQSVRSELKSKELSLLRLIEEHRVAISARDELRKLLYSISTRDPSISLDSVRTLFEKSAVSDPTSIQDLVSLGRGGVIMN